MKNSSSTKRAVTTVLRLESATVSSGKTSAGTSDIKAIQFLQGIGFTKLKSVGTKVSGQTNPEAEEVFLVEVDTSVPANQKDIYQQVMKIRSAALRVFEAKKLADGIITEAGTGRQRKPADYVKNLQTMIPRLVTNVLTAERYPDNTFASLVQNHEDAEVDMMVRQIGETIEKLRALSGRINGARTTRPAVAA